MSSNVIAPFDAVIVLAWPRRIQPWQAGLLCQIISYFAGELQAGNENLPVLSVERLILVASV